MSSPECKRQKLADDLNSIAKMSKVSPSKDAGTQTENGTSTASTSEKLTTIDENAQKFEEVAKMDGFVDRTLLIEELLQRKPKCVMIFAPSKFGKTLNLSMIRLFCEIAGTKTKEDVTRDPTMLELRTNPSKNMKVFLRQFEDRKYEECLILKKEDFFIQHFGRHPVVSFNFKDSKAKDESGAISFCAEQVQEAYLEKEYLINSKEFQSDKLKHSKLKRICTDWLTYNTGELKSLSENDVIKGLKNLIKSLRVHWGRKPVLLVDEIDKPCIVAMEKKLSEDQVREIGSVITGLICSILKPEENEELELQAALVTGICKFVNSGTSRLDNTVPVYFLSDERFSKYYGLTAQEVDNLVKRLCGSRGDAEKTNEIIRDINAKYNGYYQRSFSGENREEARYCLFSVLNYIRKPNTKKVCFWSEGHFLTEKLVSVIRKSVNILSAIRTLLYEDSGTIQIDYEEAVNVQHIHGLFREEIDPISNSVFNLLLQLGYLAHNLEKPIECDTDNMKIYVRIPNLEVRMHFKQMFQLYYDILHVQSELTFCGRIFNSLPTLNATEFQENLDRLCEPLKCIFERMQSRNESTICNDILTILKHHAEYDTGATQYAVEYFDDKRNQCVVHIDVWGRRGKFAIIFEVKFNPGASSDPGKIGCKTKSSLAAAEDIVKLLPGKKKPEDGRCGKAGTGRALEVLKSQIEKYVLIGLAVDGDYTTHMLAFQDTSDWENVIQVNPENHVAEVISTHLKSKIPVV